MTRIRLENPELRKRQILIAAEAALAEKGYHNVHLDDVAHYAQVSKGTLYLYFKDKEALFGALLAFMVNEFTNTLMGIPHPETTSPLEHLKMVVAKELEFFFAHRDFFSQFSMVKPEIYGRQTAQVLREHFRGNIQLLAQKIQACIDAGVCREHDPQMGALVLVSLLRMAGIHASVFDQGPSKPVSAEWIVDHFLHGVGKNT